MGETLGKPGRRFDPIDDSLALTEATARRVVDALDRFAAPNGASYS